MFRALARKARKSVTDAGFAKARRCAHGLICPDGIVNLSQIGPNRTHAVILSPGAPFIGKGVTENEARNTLRMKNRTSRLARSRSNCAARATGGVAIGCCAICASIQ